MKFTSLVEMAIPHDNPNSPIMQVTAINGDDNEKSISVNSDRTGG